MQLEFQCQKCEESFSMDVSDIQGDPVLRCPGCGTRAPDEQVEAVVSGLEELFAALEIGRASCRERVYSNV